MEFTMQGDTFVTDLDYGQLVVSSNEELGFRPYQLLVSSVAACSGSVLKKVLAKKRLPVESIRIKVEVVRNEAMYGKVEKIHMHFIVKGEMSEVQLQKSLEVTRKNCTIVLSVEDSIEVTETHELV